MDFNQKTVNYTRNQNLHTQKFKPIADPEEAEKIAL